MPDGGAVRPVLDEALSLAHSWKSDMVDVAIDDSKTTYVTRGVVTTDLWWLPWGDRLRMVGRAGPSIVAVSRLARLA